MTLNEEDLAQALSGLSSEARLMALRELVSETQQENARYRYPTPGALACDVDPRMRQTPALELIDQEVAEAIADGGRLIITVPPQEGKSTRVAVWTPVWALMRDPEKRVVVASYAESLARRNAMQARAILNEYGSGAVDEMTGEALNDYLGIRVAQDHRQASSWAVAGHAGGYYATGTSGALTGRAADLLIIDDPLKNQQQADSAREREKIWEWWTSVAQTRLAPGAAVIVIMCMTGDTPVLMADGRERPLRDIRPGDEVATYEGGRLTTSTVRNWRNNGPDSIYRIKMKSGVEVRANARHPFLTVKDGNETWTRLRDLKPGDTIRRATGESGEESPAPQKGVTSPQSARACACPITTGNGGLTDTGPRLSTRNPVEPPESSTDTESLPSSTRQCVRSRAGDVPYAAKSRTIATRERTGLGNSVSTMTTTPDGCVACCAMTATSPSDTESPQKPYSGPLSTYSVTDDIVAAVEPCGEEDVFDVQIDRTENFIANGLVSHNTRWHEDDLVGGILAEEDRRTEAERLWRTVNIPAIAEEGVPDALLREPGVSLESARGRTLADFRRIRGSVGARVWSSLYQGCPTPSEGGLFAREEINRGRVADADLAGLIVSVDPAESGRGDEAGVLVMGWDHTGSMYVAEDHSARMTSAVWARTAVEAALRAGAGEIVYEAFTAAETYRNVLEATWQDIARQAALLRAHDHDVLVAAELWHAEGHEGDSLTPMQDTLELLDRIPDGREAPYRLVPWRKRGDKVARAAGARQSVTTGRLRMIGTHPVLERQMVTWQVGQGSPDRVDAMVNGHDHIMSVISQPVSIALPQEW